MKATISAVLTGLILGSVRASPVEKSISPVEKRNTNSFAGSSLYLLHGLSADDQATYVNTLSDWGTTVVRLWVTGVGAGCQKGFDVANNIPDLEPNQIGEYDDTVLAALDNVLNLLAQNSMKAIISPHDGNAFGYNSCDVYAKAYGQCGDNDSAADGFYTNDNAKAQYDARMAHILNYVSPSSGQKWGQWSDAIFAFDIQNEPFQQAEDQAANNDPSDWLCGRAGNMKKVLGSSEVMLATGGVGGDQSHGNTFMPKAIECSAIDIMSIHAYVGTANFWSYFLNKNIGQCEDNNKLMMVEEWGVNSSSQDDFDTQVAAINQQGVPWTYWQMTFYDQTDCSGSCCNGGWDGYEIGFNSGKGNLYNAVQAADQTSAQQNWYTV